MLERLAGHEYYCFLDGFSGYFQIPIAPEGQEKTTFTYLYMTFAYKRMPFRLCNAPATFQLCMMAIFHKLIEDSMEVFMDDFSVFENSFDHCLLNLGKMLKRCEETNLVLNWEKCHFMVREGIVLGHKVAGAGIEVDRAKIDSIAKLLHPTNAFEKLKYELTQTSVMIKPDWSLPFEIMCDASDYAILLLQEIDIEIRDKKGAENRAADHLFRLKNPELEKPTKAEIRDMFPEEKLMSISDQSNEPPMGSCHVCKMMWKLVNTRWGELEETGEGFGEVKRSSDEDSSSFDSEDEEYAMAVKEFHEILSETRKNL
ncbi:reverse transcriptase domain-containing protein [Tanacetum coccineum]|uniref:Reverse transcriptase domain-containing protein n=1 Tax=Tanacetum coccineum TaxID=301880 RepID=A0ABQ5ER75_9ASTR